MKRSITNAGAKRPFPVLLYFACVVSSLTGTVVAPPERNFTQGQPELQQAMDNMVNHDLFMKRSVQSPSTDENGMPISLTDRTTHLLEEAERLLAALKNSKEKEWMEHFVQKLHSLANVLEQGVISHSTNVESKASFKRGSAQPSNSLTVPQQNSSESISTAVPESGPSAKLSDQTTSKQLVTLPETNQVKPVSEETAEQLVVTKPGLAPPEEKDQLVRDLENWHNTLTDVAPQIVEAPETSSQFIETDTTVSPKAVEMEEKAKIAYEKEKIKERMAEEVEKLKNLGDSEEDIIRALHINGSKLVEPTKSTTVNGKEEFHQTEEAPAGHESVKRVINAEDAKMFSRVDPRYWNRPPLSAAELPRQIYMNNTFLGMHINLPPMNMNPRLLRRQYHYGLIRNPIMANYPYYRVGGVRDTMQKFYAQNHQNFMNHMFGTANGAPQGRFNNLGPVVPNPNGISQSDSRYPPDNPALKQHPPIDPKSIYMPYPIPNPENDNGTSNDSQVKMTAYSGKPIPAEFNDEMKRQLRDGKVILLSDSVVRSNFTSDTDGKAESTSDKPNN